MVCDGDIDPEWIEALNSVLDDNRLLTLPSGWRIQFGSNVNFIFETHSLEHASPATVSRMGVILLRYEFPQGKKLCTKGAFFPRYTYKAAFKFKLKNKPQHGELTMIEERATSVRVRCASNIYMTRCYRDLGAKVPWNL